MPSSSPDLTDLIGSRICHDLISPLGAIGNGVELLAMNGMDQSPEMALIQESVANANARIRYFRIAFGAAGASQLLGAREIGGILRDISAAGRVEYDWQPQLDLPRRDVKLALLVMQCMESAMPWGGLISVTVVANQWAIAGTAERLKIEPDQWNSLADMVGSAQVSASEVQFALTPVAAAAAHRTISVERSDTTIRLRF